ncbi:MAG TPA: hypothetical protein VGN01_00260 [Acidobacteriaceae bacterium]|jgi:molybdopterin-guanine dinucleotide biosynthesis protein
MAIVVIGGHSRNIGKTSVACALIAAMPERRWTAIKITQCKHDGTSCDCELAGQLIAISEERNAEAKTDSSRYLAAGAVRSIWVRTRREQLAQAMPMIRDVIAQAENVLLESNSVLAFLQPEIYISVLDARIADFKASALGFLDRADAIVLTSGPLEETEWSGGVSEQLKHATKFQVAPPDYSSAALVAFVADRLELPVRPKD